MNICLLTPTFLPKLGGVEIIVSSLAHQYVQAGHRVVVVTQWPRPGRGTVQDHDLPYPVVRYRRPFSFLWSFGLRVIRRALDQAHQLLPYDVIHCHLAYPTGPVAMAYGKNRNIPVVITTHGSDIRTDSRYRQRGMIWRKICQTLRGANAVTAISQEMKSLLEPLVGANGRGIPLIPNAVDISDLNRPAPHDPAWPVRPDEQFILYLGGLTHKKGVDVLLKAVKTLADKKELPFTLIVAGDGADREKLQTLTATFQLNGHVRFVGKVAGPFKNYLLQRCRFVVMPSITEGFGLVAIEAFGCGKPLVASSVGGLKELMGSNEHLGLLVPPGQPELLAQAIRTMVTQVERFNPDRIRDFARKYDWPHVAQTYVDLYRQLASHPD